jgi:hypothetical protein
MEDLSLEDCLKLADAQRSYMELLFLDQVWSAMSTRPLTDEEREHVYQYRDDLRFKIDECVKVAEQLTAIVERHRKAFMLDWKDVHETIASLLGSEAEGVFGGPDFDLHLMALAGSSGLAETRPIAAEAIVAEADEIFRYPRTTDDPALLPRLFMCNFADCMMVAGALATWIPPHVQGPAVVGAGVVIHKAHKC